MILWYSAVNVFSSESDSAGDTEVRPVTSNWETGSAVAS